MLGGIEIPSPRGALGHSDADVVCHAATDAILGAASLGDIGRHFSGLGSAVEGCLEHRSAAPGGRDGAHGRLPGGQPGRRGHPRAAEDRAAPADQIRTQLARVLEILVERVSVKGKTNEGVDAVGSGEAIAAHAVALLALHPERELLDLDLAP